MQIFFQFIQRDRGEGSNNVALLGVEYSYHLHIQYILLYLYVVCCLSFRTLEEDDPSLEPFYRSQPRSNEAFWSRVRHSLYPFM